MKLMMMMSVLILMISMLIMFLSSVISKKSLFNKEKSTPFECGFNPKNSHRNTFSIQFFLIAVIFLIFDVEITLMLPLIMTMKLSNIKIWLMLAMYFCLILILGLLYEWKFGSLNWLV
uniref:NADH dehydrogenase subunit 3 n=1 Tax=Dentathalia scutellariae TaxID=1170499 RepID=UPI002206AAA6|nr:NADH dehydrogenase subunit 3 [Dentathalia scutellariae]UXW93340.1 NADH dehydrogenase subunit 3 [Dentathalia scutellariae]